MPTNRLKTPEMENIVAQRVANTPIPPVSRLQRLCVAGFYRIDGALQTEVKSFNPCCFQTFSIGSNVLVVATFAECSFWPKYFLCSGCLA